MSGTDGSFFNQVVGYQEKILSLQTDFLKNDPVEWETDVSFQEAKQVVVALQVVNDVAERGVAIVKNYNGKVTRDENSFQNLLLVSKN